MSDYAIASTLSSYTRGRVARTSHDLKAHKPQCPQCGQRHAIVHLEDDGRQ